MAVSASIRALLTELVDYAGLFPPAQLPLDDAIRNFARYRNEPEAWMLGRFICPAPQLDTLATYADELFRANPPFRFSVLGRGGADEAAFRAGLQQDLADIDAFRRRHGDSVSVEAFETRLPAGLTADPCTGPLVKLLDEARAAFGAAGLAALPLSFEIALGRADRANIQNAVAGISFAAFKQSGAAGGSLLFKLRCGGVEATAFPAVETVAFAVAQCAELGVPLKFTAGLHHPLRLFHDSVNTKMHGFLNVFVGSILARVHGLAEQQVGEMISDERREAFRFDADGVTWGPWRASAAEIAEARREFATSFGSCSFDEPRTDLSALGLL